MTLIKDVEAAKKNNMKKSTASVASIIKFDKFESDIRRLAIYLGNFYRKEIGRRKAGFLEDEIDYASYILRTENDRGYLADIADRNFICVAGGEGKSTNPYVRMVVENIFPCNRYSVSLHGDDMYSQKELLKYSSDNIIGADEKNDSYLNSYINGAYKACEVWRDDLKYPADTSEKILKVRLGRRYPPTINPKYAWGYGMWYNVFWNLFLLALDDEIFEAQLNNVVELASYWNFDEPMMRDWCRAVEYVMAGNKFSEDCDFECETVEGMKFFLHRDG